MADVEELKHPIESAYAPRFSEEIGNQSHPASDGSERLALTEFLSLDGRRLHKGSAYSSDSRKPKSSVRAVALATLSLAFG